MHSRGKEFGLKVVWNRKVTRGLLKVLSSATRLVEVSSAEAKQEEGTPKVTPKKRSGAIPLDDCFKEHN